MSFTKSKLRASLIAVAVSTSSLLAEDIINEEFSSAVSKAVDVIQQRVEDSETTLLKINGITMNGAPIPLGSIWSNEVINGLGMTYFETAVQPANFQQMIGQQTQREYEDTYVLAAELSSGTQELYLSVQLIDRDRESVIATNTVTLPRSSELAPLVISSTTSGGVVDFFEPDDEASPNDLLLGESVEGHTLTDGDDDWYTFTETDKIQQVTVYTSSSIDTQMELHKDGEVLISDDDSGSEENARISFITEPGATYKIKVTGYDSDATGAYTLHSSAEEYELPEDEPNNTQEDAYTIPFGETYSSGLVPASDIDFYRVELGDDFEAGTLLTFQTKGSVDTQMRIYSEDGTFINEDDDSGDDDNALIAVPAGSHKILLVEISPYDSDEGSYTLEMSSSSPDEIEFDERYNGHFSATEHSNLLRLELPRSVKGEMLTIETQGSQDTQLKIFDADGIALAENDDDGIDENARLSIPVEGGEVFIIEVTPYDSDSYGPYQLIHSVQ